MTEVPFIVHPKRYYMYRRYTMEEFLATIGGLALLGTPVLLVLSLILALFRQPAWKIALCMSGGALCLALLVALCLVIYEIDPDWFYIVCIAVVSVCATVYAFRESKKTRKFLKLVENLVEEEIERVVKTVLIAGPWEVSPRRSKLGIMAQTVIDYELGGYPGVLLGAAAREKANKYVEATFLVFYKDGTQLKKTLDSKSKLFDVYVSKLDSEV